MATKSVKIGAAVLGGALVVVLAVLAGRSMGGSPKKAASQSTTTTAATVPGGLVEFRDKAGWAISYPRTWNVLQSQDADVVLVVSEKPPELNNGGSILGRDLTLGTPVDEAKLPAAKQVTDQIVTSAQGIQMLAEPTIIHQGGLPGYFYFYSFKDPATGQEGVHTHYFLFKGSTMISFVFQALPKDNFQALAHLFDEVIGSFRVIPPGG